MPGTITFRPLEANLAKDTDLIGKADPYCMFTIGGQVTKSQVCKSGGKHPVWNDAVTIPLTSQGICLVEVKDKDLIKDDKMGAFQLDLQQVLNQGRLKQWFPLLRRDKPAGELLMEVTFTPDGYSQGMGMQTGMQQGMQTGIQTGMQPGMQTGIHTGMHSGMPMGVPTVTKYAGPTVTEKTRIVTKETYVNGVKVDGHSHCHNTPQTAYPVNNMSSNNQYAQEALIRGVDPLGTQQNQYPQQYPGSNNFAGTQQYPQQYPGNNNYAGTQTAPQANLGYPQQQVGGQYNQNFQNQPQNFGQAYAPRKF